MKTRRFLAAVLVMVMLFALMPVTAKAADDTVYDAGKLYLDKTAILEDDGTYTIRMEAFATGTPVTTSVITGKPLDVVLVIDQSGSMYNYGYTDDLEKALDTFIAQLAENGKTIGKTHRVAVVGFACSTWELTVTHSVGTANGTPYPTNLPIANGSYGSLWTNTGIYLSDGTFKNYQEFEFTEIAQSELPTYTNNTDAFYVNPKSTYGTYTYTQDGNTYTVNRDFPLYFVDDTETWKYTDENGGKHPQTVRRAIYQYSDGLWYYDFRGYDLNSTKPINMVKVNGDGKLRADQKVYRINYGTYTGDSNLSNMFEGGRLTDADYQNTFMNVTDGVHGAGNVTTAINNIIDNLGASGATRTGVGMEMAYNILEKNPLTDEDKAEGRERVVIVFTDGEPGRAGLEIEESNIALEYGAKIKDLTGTEENVEIYTIGLHDPDKQAAVGPYDQTAQFMNGLSSNYPDADNMEDVWGTITKQNYNKTNMEVTDYRDSTWSTVTDFYAKIGEGVYKKIQVRYTNNRWEFRTEDSETNNLDYSVTDSGWIWKSYHVNNQETYKLTTTTSEGYLPSGTPAVDGGKYYKEASAAADLEHMFPTIVTESTSTSMDSVYLTEGSILRDIMGAGFLLTGETTISTFTETGTWTSTNDTHTEGTIAWSGTEVPRDTLHVEDPKTLTKPDVTDPIQIYNTNPGPNNDNVGGNFYETASGELNLSAPPTVDVTGFDYEEEYLAFNKEGKRLIVTITGVEAQALDVLYNQQNNTNHYQSGLWSPMDEVTRQRELVGSFPVPTTTFTEALYVLDYAKPMTLNPADLKMSVVKSLDIDGMNGFESAVTEITEGNGIVTVENGKYVYRPTTTAWNGYDTFYVFGNTEDQGVLGYSANDALDNLWGRVNVLPANNVYYEDTFIESQNGVTVGIVYDGTWDTVGTESGNQELPESGEDEEYDFGGVHGWEDYLADDTRYSDGSATTSSTAGATATFTFTGTGVDVYSYTDMEQGAVMASIYEGEDTTAKPLYSLIMDNFSLSGDYYQIPTLSLHEKYLRDEADKNVKDEDGNNVLVPLGFGTYTVKLTVMPKTDDADGDGVKTTRYTYTLDGIRIYNPIQNIEDDQVVQKAYGEEELNASFVEVRNILLEAGSFDADGECYGVVFLDQVPNGDGNLDNEEEGTVGQPSDQYENAIGVYEDYGPKNEVYLASGQGVAFLPKAGYRYYVGLKSPTGETVAVHILKDGSDMELLIDHTTDLYYEVTPEDGIVLIENSGFDKNFNEYDNLLSITKLKVTSPDGSEVEPAEFFEPVDQPTVLRMVRTVREEAAAEPEVPEETEPSAPDVDIDNPSEPGEPEEDGSNDGYLWQVIGGIFDWIRYIIFG